MPYRRKSEWREMMEDVFEECFHEEKKRRLKDKKSVEMEVKKVKVYQPVISIKPWK